MAGPEAANNASATGVLVPLLTLGIPTSATAAILLGAFQNYGLQPGPLLFESQKDLVWGLIASLYVGNIILLILNLPLIGIWVKVLEIPKDLLYAGILVFATLGAYSLHQSWVDLLTLYVFGLLGFAMRRWDIPVGPAVIGLILGPLAETQFRRALSISQGDASVFFTQPISATFLAITAALVIVPFVVRHWGRLRRRLGGTHAIDWNAARLEAAAVRRLPAAKVLGPEASEDEISALIESHGSVFVKPVFKGGVGKKGKSGLIGRAKDLKTALAEKERLYFVEHRVGNVVSKAQGVTFEGAVPAEHEVYFAISDSTRFRAPTITLTHKGGVAIEELDKNTSPRCRSRRSRGSRHSSSPTPSPTSARRARSSRRWCRTCRSCGSCSTTTG